MGYGKSTVIIPLLNIIFNIVYPNLYIINLIPNELL